MKEIFKNFSFGTLLLCVAIVLWGTYYFSSHKKEIGTKQYSPIYTETSIFLPYGNGKVRGKLIFNRDSVTDTDIEYAKIFIHSTILLKTHKASVDVLEDRVQTAQDIINDTLKSYNSTFKWYLNWVIYDKSMQREMEKTIPQFKEYKENNKREKEESDEYCHNISNNNGNNVITFPTILPMPVLFPLFFH